MNPRAVIANSPPVDAVGVAERVARFGSRSIKTSSKLRALKLILSMLDLTTLEGKDTEDKVRRLCHKAAHLHADPPDLPTVAAVCVYPTLVKVARRTLEGSGIAVASVATAFPAGQDGLRARVQQTKKAVRDGADEIDMVISRGRFLAGDYGFVHDEIVAVKEVCGDAHLKVILETGELHSLDNIRKASNLALAAGADFIKTSTGKVQPAATMEVTLVMLEAIRDHYLATGRAAGMKPAGGISNAKTALRYLVMLRETLGAQWLVPNLFRFGASSLANDVLMQIRKQQTGAYQSPEHFSND